jgi:hypothetical protein
MQTPSQIVLASLALIVLCWPATAADPGLRCAEAKQRAAAKKVVGKVKCNVRAKRKGEPVDSACLAKVETIFASTFQRVEAKGGCATTHDAQTIENKVDTFVADLMNELPATTTTTTTSTTVPAPACGERNGICGGDCPDGFACNLGGQAFGCHCDCHPTDITETTGTCPPTTTTTTTLP